MVEEYEALLAPLFGSRTIDSTIADKLEVFALRDLVALIDIALETEEILARIQQASFRHPNGFDRIVLRRDNATKRALRLHAWGSPSVSAQQDIHNHAWSFASHVLAGSFRHSSYEFHSEPAAATALYGFTRGDGDRYRFRLIERGFATITNSKTVKSGQTFKMEASTFHTFLPLDYGGKTLVLHYPVENRDSSEMIRSYTSNDKNEEPVLEAYTIDEIKSILKDVQFREYGGN